MDEAGASQPSRRTVVAAFGLLPLASLAPSVLGESQARAKSGKDFQFFDAHEAAVVRAAAARLIPGPTDDPIEALYKSPGATEADVVRYIDTMLSVFDDDPPKIFAGGPWSDRHGGKVDYMKHFVPPAPRQIAGWKERVRQLRSQYRDAVKALDAAAKGKDFANAGKAEQDRVLTKLGDVRDLIFGHSIEGMYSVPEYGGNRDRAGWKSIYWPGDVQPRGYTPAEVERNDGEDVLVVTDTITAILGLLPKAASHMIARGWPRG